MKKIISVQDMHAFAGEVANGLRGGEVLGLEGDLGTGKTEFVRGLVEAFGSKDSVKSPSFTLLNHYRLNHKTIKHLIHVDLYRLEGSTAAVEEIGIDEWLTTDGKAGNREDVVIVIEWPLVLQEKLPLTKLFRFRYGEGEMERTIDFSTEND